MKISKILSKEHYKLLVVGGGSAGCAVASKFGRILNSIEIAIVEPNKNHYYQPGFTFVGSGIFKLGDVIREEASVLPKNVCWLKYSAAEFFPHENRIQLKGNGLISYDYLVIAVGLELRYDLVSGLSDDILQKTPGICSIYSPKHVEKVLTEADNFEEGNMIFTFPNTPIKCAGAPQKIMYLLEERLRRNGKRGKANIIYNTSLNRIFSVEKYSNSLEKVAKARNIRVNVRHNLTKVDTSNRIATFEILNEDAKPTGDIKNFEYSFLHVAPPCSPPKVLRETKARGLTDASGWVDVNVETLRSHTYPNVFAIGDCANLPTSKTMAAIFSASQFKTLSANLQSAMADEELNAKYNGYTSCPLVVDSQHVILAEFNGAGTLETFPYDQSRPSRFAFLLKRYFMPILYWNFLLNGRWNGPETFRKFFNIFKTK